MKKYNCIIAGIDTLEIGYCISKYKLSHEEWEMIEQAKLSAQSTLFDKSTGIRFRGYEFSVLRTGSTRYKYILDNDDIQIRIFSDARAGLNFPELKVSFRSEFLWRHGWKDAVSKTEKWIRSWADIEETKVSRIDIMVDLKGELPLLSPEIKEVVTRARKKNEKGGDYSRHSDGRKRSGYNFGKGGLLCRIYDKSAEILLSGKRWFEDIWKKNGWNDGEKVTRVEFQCRRKIIRQFQIENIDELFKIVPDLWKYLAEEWLTIRVMQNDTHRTRWPVSEFWLVVQGSIREFGKITGVSRLKQLIPKRIILERQARGLSYCLAALAIKSKPGSDIRYGKQFIRGLVNKWLKAPECDDEINKRKHRYDSMEY